MDEQERTALLATIDVLERENRVLAACANRVPASEPAALRPGEQTCSRCGAVDKMNFHVDDQIWEAVTYPEWANECLSSVLCLACFDDLAAAREIEYVHTLSNVVFVGARACFYLEVRDPRDITVNTGPDSQGER